MRPGEAGAVAEAGERVDAVDAAAAVQTRLRLEEVRFEV